MEVVKNLIINNTVENQIEKNRMQMDYYNYILEHRNNVLIAFNKYIVPLLEKENICSLVPDSSIKSAINNLIETIQEHDSSKFGEDEFEAYRMKYNPTTYEKSFGQEYWDYVEEHFQEAWKSHYTNNDHHPKYWVNSETGEIRDMTIEAILEMISDWEAMSIKFNSKTIDWYENEATHEKDCMTGNTKAIVEELLYKVIYV